MKSKLSKAIVLLLVFVAGYFSYKYYQFARDPYANGIPPHENSDGTVDYTLATPGSAEVDRYYWVVRLPKDQYAKTSESGESPIGIINGVGYAFRSYSNQSLGLYYKLPSFEPFKSTSTVEERIDGPSIRVTLLNNWSDPAKDSANFLNEHVTDCIAKGEVEKNLFAYGPYNSNRGRCPFREASFETIGYSIRNDAGLHIAEMLCIPGQNTDCSGTMTLPVGRDVLFSFNYKFLPRSEYVKAITRVSELISSTVVRVEKVRHGQTYLPKGQ